MRSTGLKKYIVGLLSVHTQETYTAIRRAKDRVVELKELIDIVVDNIDRPILETTGIYVDALKEVNAAEKEKINIDFLYVGDLSVSFEVILEGPRVSIQKFEYSQPRQRIIKAKVLEVWLSALLPFYCLDRYSMMYDRKTRTWEFHPEKMFLTKTGRRLESKILEIIEAHGLRRLGRRLCAEKLEGIKLSPDKSDATIFDCLFTNTKAFDRLEFKKNGFNTRNFRIGGNHDGRIVVPGVLDLAVPGIKAHWEESLSRSGKLLNRKLELKFPGHDTVRIVQGKSQEINSIELCKKAKVKRSLA